MIGGAGRMIGEVEGAGRMTGFLDNVSVRLIEGPTRVTALSASE
jgi:hypothetical protein